MQHRRPAAAFAAFVLAALPLTAAAQEQDVARGSYPYFQRTLTVAVNADVPGELQVIRGRAARVEVAALASPGVATFAMGGYRGDELLLTAAGAERAVFIITVPERVYVSVRAPGTSRSLGAFTPVETIRWNAMDKRAQPAPGAPRLVPENGYYTVYGAGSPPRSIVMPSLASVRRLDVHIGDGPFRVSASRPLEVSGGRPEPLVVDIAGAPLDLRVELPAGTRAFNLQVAGQVVLQVENGRFTRYCSPALAQDLGAGQSRLTLTPRAGRLDCDPR